MPGSESFFAQPSNQENQGSPEQPTGAEGGVVEVAVDEPLPPDKQISKLKRFLEAVVQLALPEKVTAVQNLILKLVEGEVEPGEFFKELTGATKFPPRPYVIPFLYSSLPLLNKECGKSVRDEIKCFLLDGDCSCPSIKKSSRVPLVGSRKRKPNLVRSETTEKRPAMTEMWQVGHAADLRWFSCGDITEKQTQNSIRPNFSPGTQSTLGTSTSTVHSNSNGGSNNNNNNNYLVDPWAWYAEEWKQIDNLYATVVTAMERLRYSMILFQQRSRFSQVWTQQQQQQRRDTSVRLEEVQRKADVTVQEVKKAAVLELQKAVQVAERKAMETVAAERAKWEKIFRDTQKQEDSAENCWNCGRKAGQTCGACGIARYCGIFCQHKDWEKHRSMCTVQNSRSLSPLNIKVEAKSPGSGDVSCSETPQKSPPKRV